MGNYRVSRDTRQNICGFMGCSVEGLKKKICVSAGIVYENEEGITW